MEGVARGRLLGSSESFNLGRTWRRGASWLIGWSSDALGQLGSTLECLESFGLRHLREASLQVGSRSRLCPQPAPTACAHSLRPRPAPESAWPVPYRSKRSPQSGVRSSRRTVTLSATEDPQLSHCLSAGGAPVPRTQVMINRGTFLGRGNRRSERSDFLNPKPHRGLPASAPLPHGLEGGGRHVQRTLERKRGWFLAVIDSRQIDGRR
jgi:hypothetical protein